MRLLGAFRKKRDNSCSELRVGTVDEGAVLEELWGGPWRTDEVIKADPERAG
jgi:hypothetical protein